MTYNHENHNLWILLKKGSELQWSTGRSGPKCKSKSFKTFDVEKLLIKHYGSTWDEIERLKWYQNVIDNNRLTEEAGVVSVDPQCECTDEENHDSVEIIENVLL